MKKFFLAILVFSALFVFKSAHADSAHAGATINGNFSNAQGAIPIKVTMYITRGNGTNASCDNGVTTNGIAQGTLGPSSAGTVVCLDSVDSGPYTLSYWYNSCGDGGNATTTGSGGTYDSISLNAHCTNTNSTITITDTKCTDTNGTVTWRLNVNSDGTAPNIKTPFKVYKSTGVADTDTSPVTQAYTPGPPVVTSYTLANITLPATGNYNIAVKSYTPNPPDNNSYSAPGVMLCAGSMIPPTNFVAVTSCTGTTPIVSFTWTGAGPAATYTFAYLVETNLYTNGDPGTTGSWTGPPSTPGPPTSTTYVRTSSLTSAQTYYAHVKAVATPASTPANLFSASISFTVPTCTSSATAPPTLTGQDVITCASTTDNGDLTDNSTDNYKNANPSWAKISWTRATPNASIQTEQLQYSTDSSFAVPSTIDYGNFTYKDPSGIHFGSQGMDILTGLTINTKYYFRVKTQMSDNSWVVSDMRNFVTPYACFDSGIQLSGYGSISAFGYGYCVGTQGYVRLRWTINNPTQLTSGYTFMVARNYGSTGFFYTYTVDFSWTGPSNYDSAGDGWSVYGPGGLVTNFGPVGITPQSCTSATAPSNLTVPQMACSFVLLQFQDNATNETGWQIDISSVPFSDNPTTYGTRTIPSTGAGAPWDYGYTQSFYWTNDTTYSNPPFMPLATGNANPQPDAPPGSALIPVEGVTYYWRVRANGTGGNSAYKYDDGTPASSVYPSGRSFTMPYCSPRSDLSAKIVSMQDQNGKVTQSFQVSDTVTVKFRVANEPVSGAVNNPATKLYYYYNGVGVPNCATNNPDNNSLGPLGPDGVQRLSVDIPQNALIPTESKEYTTTFTATQTGSFTGYGYVVPSCVMSGGKDPNFANNGGLNGFSYTVGVAKFFETQGGDVGAGSKATIKVGVSNPPNPYNISDYLIAGNDSVSGTISGLKVNSSTGRKLSGYLANQVLGGGGVYKYFADRFRAKAMANSDPNGYGCSIQSRTYNDFTNNLYYCAGDVTINASTIITGTPVFFIDGDLNINANLTVAAGSKAVFIVNGGGANGGISVATAGTPVTLLSGIFISRKGFVDGTSGGVITGVGNKLTITGALYVDGLDGGSLQLNRYWGGSDVGLNATTPSETIVFDPGYIATLGTILSSSSVGWKEVAP